MSIPARGALACYTALGWLLGPVVRRVLARRRAAGKEHATRWPERLGRPGLARPPGPLVWFHAASNGEALSILPLITRLGSERPDVTSLVTTGTLTSAQLMAERLPDRALHQFVPVDLPLPRRRFLDHWRPDLAVWVESELWPGLIADAARHCPLLLVNGRMSARSFRQWRRVPWLARAVLGRFAERFGQSADDAARLTYLAGAPARHAGNLKWAAPPLPHDPDELARLRRILGTRPIWLAASTHPGEEEAIAAAHADLAAGHPGLVTVIVPRHPPRGPELAARHGWPRRAEGADLPAADGVYLADTLGELGLWYRLAPIAFIGGSLVGRGGQNPLEGARLGAALLAGPDMDNFAAITAALEAANGLARVTDGRALAGAVADLLADPVRRDALAVAAQHAATADDRVLAETMAALHRHLPVPGARSPESFT